MADTGETWESKRTGICHTCVKIIKIYGTNEYVAPWHCECNDTSKISSKQLKFSAGRFVGTAFKHAWQGAPKGKRVLYRPSK